MTEAGAGVQRAVLATRASVRNALGSLRGAEQLGIGDTGVPAVLVGLSGGADSLALAAALAFEAPRVGVRAGAVVVDHGLQEGSEEIATRAAAQAAALGLEPVIVRRVEVGGSEATSTRDGTGPEARARTARYAAFREVAEDAGAAAILTAHTRDDQAEQVLLALARGSGVRSLAGIPGSRPLGDSFGRDDRRHRLDDGAGDDRDSEDGTPSGAILLRPFLAPAPEITRSTTAAACAELGLDPWHDPQNLDPDYARVRVRERLLPAFERELGPGIAAALARTADLARDDADALDGFASDLVERHATHAEGRTDAWEIPVSALADQPAAIRNRVIREIASRGFGSSPHREHTLGIAALVTNWHGQGPVFAPGIRVTRAGGVLRFARQQGSPRR